LSKYFSRCRLSVALKKLQLSGRNSSCDQLLADRQLYLDVREGFDTPPCQDSCAKHNLIAVYLSRLEKETEEPQEKPSSQCMAAIMARSVNYQDELTPDNFEMAESFGDTNIETEYTFPMKIPYIAEDQHNDT
jgi:hypothetical protein